ncbi:MAG: ABC transporter permease [Spirochaetales bacterium]|jgi:putative ABC transport system permease protein
MIAAKMAYGNLFLHKAKSLLLGTIMCLGIAVLFVGNSLIDTAIGGLRKMFVEGFTGDLMVTGPTAFPTTIFGETAGGEQVIPHIDKFPDYEKFLASEKGVAATLPLLGGQVEMGLGEQVIGRGSAFGVDVERYKNFFSGNVTIVDGSWPNKGDLSWIVISETSAAMLSRAAGKKIGPGEKIILSALGDTAGIVIREVKVAGIVRFNQSNQQLARISLVDADTMRDLLGFASLRDTAVKLTPDQQQFVTAFDPSSLFDNPTPAVDSTAQSAPAANAGAVASQEPASTAVAPVPAWQYLLVKLAPGASSSKVLADLTKYSAGIDEGDHVQDWIAGAGTVARTAVTIRLIFDLMIFIVAVIVIMITMNVLVVSISERVPEIGTLRALGAKKQFIRRMILLETTFLAVIAGAFGLLLGYAILLLMKKSGIAAPNLFFEAIFAGKNLVPVISLSGAIKAFLWIFGMSILSSLYPIALALRIKPVVAMQGE